MIGQGGTSSPSLEETIDAASSTVRATHRVTTLIVVTALSLSMTAVAVAGGATSVPTFVPKMADQVTNLDILRSQIKNYYGTPTAAAGAACNKDLAPAADGNYAAEAASVAGDGGRWLSTGDRATSNAMKAIVLDVDDTTLATWNYELCSNWAFDPVTNGQFVTDQRFPAVPGMVAMANQAAADGYAVFFLTGRGQAQEAATLGNLTHDGIGVDAGYPAPSTLTNGEDGLFTKPPVGSYPAYLDKPEFCAASIAANNPARRSSTSPASGPTSRTSATRSSPTSATSSAT